MRLGVVVAHPDDEVLGCGGTLAKYHRLSVPTRVLFLGSGAEYQASPSLGDISNAAKILGYQFTMASTPPPDNQFDTASLLSLVRKVSAWLAREQITHVLTHSPDCLNIDHRLVCQAVVTATRPGTSTVDAVYAFETPSATEWSFARAPWRPTRFEALDIADVDAKLAAMACYRTEDKPYPHARSQPMLRAKLSVDGATAGCEWAEALIVLRELVR